MKFRKRAIAAVAVSAIIACGALAGCDGLTTNNARKDYEQVVAEVNITSSDDFKEGGKFAGKGYETVVSTSEITKRDLVSLFAAQGGSLVNSGYSYGDIFDTICETLINRQVYIQYAMVYYLDGEPETYTVEGFGAEVEAARAAAEAAGYSAERTELAAEIAGLGYFLDDAEENKALYDLKVSVNDALDSQEESFITATDEHDHDEDVRTLPTGVETEDEDYCAESYEIYTGTGSRHVADCGEYEPVEGSTVTTRKKAYTQFLNNLRSYALLFTGEDTSEIENLIYYSMEVKNAYESALLEKLSDSFEAEAEAKIAKTESGDWASEQFAKKLSAQINGYRDSEDSTFETALDNMSDTSFVLAAPEAYYGFVINILLPFSTSQTKELEKAPIDSGDVKGNKFVQRASLLKNIKATDQRGTWFTGEEDYSFDYTGKEGATAYNGSDATRKYLFFEDCLPDAEGNTGTGYEALKNYYGQYTYNGKVTEKEEKGHTHYTLKPNKIDIDTFIGEMEGYLKFALGDAAVAAGTKNETFYTQTDYYKEGTTEVDYAKFIYYSGNVNFTEDYNANKLFVRGSEENKALSVINELSFAYNTDTGGLNTYLGYAVTPGKTNFVSEFEYAAHEVCKAGAGHYVVVPSEYGWHIIYCTFSFTEAGVTPFEYDDAQKGEEGTFSYLFYENLKSQSVSQYTSAKQTQIINTYAETCAEKYADRYADLANISA